jgi:hypothetical protein
LREEDKVAIEYPEILNEWTMASERYEVDGVQYVVDLEPKEMAAGAATFLSMYLQNVLNVPVGFSVRPQPQLTRQAKKANAGFSFSKEEPSVTLKPGEVGRLVLPIGSDAALPAGRYKIQVEFRGKPEGRGQRVRSQRGKSRLRRGLIDDVVGLGLVPVLGSDFKCRGDRRISFNLNVTGPLAAPEKPDLPPTFESLWTQDDLGHQGKAQQEVNERRAYIITELASEPIFVNLLAETWVRFREAGLDLHLGEALGVARILTYTAEYFLKDSVMQDGLLVPIFERAIREKAATGEILPLLRSHGYYHLTRLACAISFGLVAEGLKKQPWSVEERRAVTDLVAIHLDTGQVLPPEFMYVPLLLGSIQVARRTVMEGEDSRESLRMLQEAKTERAQIFKEDEELQQVGQVFDQLMAVALR